MLLRWWFAGSSRNSRGTSNTSATSNSSSRNSSGGGTRAAPPGTPEAVTPTDSGRCPGTATSAAVPRYDGVGIAFDPHRRYSIGGRNRFAGIGVYVARRAAGRRKRPADRNLSRRTHEDSFCSIVWRAHARQCLRVGLPLPRRHEEDRRGAGKEPEAVGAAGLGRQEVPRRRRGSAQGGQAPGIGRHAGQGDEDPGYLTCVSEMRKRRGLPRRFHLLSPSQFALSESICSLRVNLLSPSQPVYEGVCLKRWVASTSAPRIPGSHAECPASGTTRNSAWGQARCSSYADTSGQTMS